MARDPETIQRDIDRARDALSGSLDALGERANPGKLVETGKASVAHTLSDPRVKYGLIAFGALVVLALVRVIVR